MNRLRQGYGGQDHGERDHAIDRVAAKLVSVAPDPSMIDRLVSQLPAPSRRRLPSTSLRPGKPSPSNWMWLAPQVAAALGVAVFAFFLFSNRPADVEERAVSVPAPAPAPPAAIPAPAVTATPAARVPVAAKNVSAPATMEMDNTFDREFGLKPVALPEPITVAAIAVAPEIEVPAPELAPIVLTDLPAANDSPR